MTQFKDQFALPSTTQVTGARAVTDITEKRVKLDVSDKIFAYDPNAASLTRLLTKARKKRKVSQYKFHWLEKDRYPRFDAVNKTAGYDADDVTITVDDGTKFFANALCMNKRTRERFYVTSVATNDLTVTRDLNSTAKPMVDNDVIEILSPTYVEGGDLGTSKSVKEREVEQFTQQIRTPFSLTGRDMHTAMYGGTDQSTERRWQAVEHAISIEKAMWWSVKDSQAIAASGKFTTFMSGVHELVSDNVWDVNAIPFTERSFTEYLEYAMRYGDGGKMGSRQKFMFCSPRFITEVESWGKEKLYYHGNTDVYGIDATTYRSAHGKVMLIEHPLFEEEGDIAFLLDLNHIRYAFHQGRDTKLLSDRGGNGVDGETWEFLSDVSLQVELASAHGFIRNLPL